MSDKTPGERAFDKFFGMVLPAGYPRFPWKDIGPKYQAAWEAAAEEAHTAYVVNDPHWRNKISKIPEGFKAYQEKLQETKPQIDWLAINRSCA